MQPPWPAGQFVYCLAAVSPPCDFTALVAGTGSAADWLETAETVETVCACGWGRGCIRWLCLGVLCADMSRDAVLISAEEGERVAGTRSDGMEGDPAKLIVTALGEVAPSGPTEGTEGGDWMLTCLGVLHAELGGLS